VLVIFHLIEVGTKKVNQNKNHKGSHWSVGANTLLELNSIAFFAVVIFSTSNINFSNSHWLVESKTLFDAKGIWRSIASRNDRSALPFNQHNCLIET
jgi:hypothetical protein